MLSGRRGGLGLKVVAGGLIAATSPRGVETVVPDIVVAPGDAGVVVRPEPEFKGCFHIEKTEPRPTALSARFGVYRADVGWWWRLEIVAPAPGATDPKPPESAPVVLVLDASRSMERRGGIAAQLAVARAYLVNTPSAQVELILTSRTAERVFGHFVPATELDTALAGRLAEYALKNGSFLDRGAELAADALVAAGKPGRVLFMTDGGLRSRFNQNRVVNSLKRAPAGTIVHVLHPEPSSTSEIRHLLPQGLDALSAALGGASYDLSVAPDGSGLAPMLKRLVSPDRIESLTLHDLEGGAEWPDFSERHEVQDEILYGAAQTWGGVSAKRPPGRLALFGWIWGKRVEIRFQTDPRFQRLLPRIATSDSDLMECVETDRHWKRALSEGFLAPNLRFFVPGRGDPEGYGSSGDCLCEGDSMERGGGLVRGSPPAELPPEIASALEPCHLAKSKSGTIRVKLESYGSEIADVVTEGGDAGDRRCAEEALWGAALPGHFNDDRFWSRVDYAFALARSPKPDASP